MGAGGPAGRGEAANLLKPAPAGATLRTIAATTWSEYKKYIEKDPALTRRFQVVQVLEPDEDETLIMVRGVASTLEKHHRVQLLDEALEAAVKLSHRYIPARHLPAKAVSLLDTTGARVAVSQHATPPDVEDSRRRIEALETELAIIGREDAAGFETGARRTESESRLAAEKERLVGLEQRWAGGRELVDKNLELRRQLRDEVETAEPSTREARLTELRGLQAKLTQAQGESPLILPSVDAQAVASVVADWTGVPVGRMVKNEVEAVLKLADTLSARVVGQRHGLEMIAKRIETSRARLDNPDKPIGVFLLSGPSGVGKTETALALAEALYGGEQNMITINMSEFQEAHTVSALKGAPPGYVGYGEGGRLTEAVRRRPYSVILLDEVEKAHPDVHEVFFQVFDKGFMDDGNGRRIDFKNTLIILTTNVGTDIIMERGIDPALRDDPDALAQALRPELLNVFPAALLGRMVAIAYRPLSDEMLAGIVRLQLDRIGRRIRDNHAVEFSYEPAVVDHIVAKCDDPNSGGRMIDNIITNTLLPALSREFLRPSLAAEEVRKAEVTIENGDFAFAWE